MSSRSVRHLIVRLVFSALGFFLLPGCWLLAKTLFEIPDIYLPSLTSVVDAAFAIEPNLLDQVMATSSRLLVGFTIGTALGISTGILLARWRIAHYLLSPTVHALRAVPAVAAVPFFLMWFGFSEVGRYLIVLSAVGLNVAVASQQILVKHSRAHLTFFCSFELQPGAMPFRYSLPRILEDILPTLRYSLALSIGVVAVAELLGSQIGLGYLLQTGRSTFSFGLMFLAIIMIGLIASLFDLLLQLVWSKVVYWRPL